MLEPKEGYIIRTNADGQQYYQPTMEQLEKENQQVLLQKLQLENAALSEQLAQSDEAAITLFESKVANDAVNAQQDEAILAIYEKLETTGGTTA